MMKKIAILGSTGSIGVSALDVIAGLKGRFEVVGLAADSNIELLSRQARIFRPKIISVGNGILAKEIKNKINAGTRVVCGPDGLREIVSRPDIETVLFAISGTACLLALIEAIRGGKRIALANKESLVSAGHAIMKEAAKSGVRIIPVDSEHSAIFQCIAGRERFLSKIYLTASGGPLLDIPKGRFDTLPRSFMLKHPRWNMGKKISVDSATMMNKGLEVIEAMHLFDIDEKSIEVLIHPEAVIHSMVELVDGTVMAQLGTADMRNPIHYALTYPERSKNSLRKMDFAKVGKLSFRTPDVGKFPCLKLARDAARSGGTAPAVLCACDEELVKRYLEGSIRFSDIPKIITKLLARHKNIKRQPSIKDVLEADGWAREETVSLCYH